MHTNTKVFNVPNVKEEKAYQPRCGDIIVTKNGDMYIVAITSYDETKLICLKEGSRWSDLKIEEAIAILESHEGPLRVASGMTISVSFD